MATQETINNITNYYTNLLIAQYKTKPKATTTIDLIVRNTICGAVYLDIQNAYDLDNAIGNQLDTIGKIVGVDRKFIELILLQHYNMPYFASFDNDFTILGTDFVGSSNAIINGKIMDNRDMIGNEILQDDIFRILIKYKIIYNNINMSNTEISQALYNFFQNDIIVVDNEDMRMTYFINNDISALISVVIRKNLLPKPIGVNITTMKYYNMPYFASFDNNLDINKIDCKFFIGSSDIAINGKIMDNKDMIV